MRVLIACLVLAAACVPPRNVHSDDSAQLAGDETRVMDLEKSYWAAEQRHDSAAVDSLLAPDYVSMSSRARGDRSKGQELALLFGGRVHLESYEFSNMRATRVAPDVIVLHLSGEPAIYYRWPSTLSAFRVNDGLGSQKWNMAAGCANRVRNRQRGSD